MTRRGILTLPVGAAVSTFPKPPVTLLAREALRVYINVTGDASRPLTVRALDREPWEGWARVRSGDAGGDPIDLVYEMPDLLACRDVDALTEMARALLLAQVPEVWESDIEDRLVAGVLAHQYALENLAVDLYRRVHL